MNKDYDYRLYKDVKQDLEENGFKHIDTLLVQNSAVTHSYQLWKRGLENLLVEIYRDSYCALYIDIEKVPKK